LDTLNLVAIILRVFLVITAPILSLMVLNIYRKTEGGSKGWLYMAVSFGSLGIWAISQLILTFAFNTPEGRLVIGILMFIFISLFAPLSAIRLARDMKCEIPKWMIERNVVIIYAVFFGALIGYNLMTSSNLLGSLSSASILSIIPTFIIAWMGYCAIAKTTGKILWKWLAWGCIITMIGAVMIVSTYTNCCGAGAPLSGEVGCETWSYDYSPAIPFPCMAWALPFTSNSGAVVLVGILVLIFSIEKLRRAMSV